jgi:pimeloyl-ACP methyl ester carboxylesterase
MPLLFLHGWQADGRVWTQLATSFEDRYRTIVLDLRGAGASNAAPGPFTVERFAADAGDLIDALGLDPAVVIGHSMGATVAMRLAIDRPEAVEALVLVAPVPAGGLPLPPKVLDFLRSTAGDAERRAQWLATLTVAEQSPETRSALRGAAATVPREAALEMFDSWQPGSFADEAATIATPALVLAPSHDRPAFVKEHVADPIVGSSFVVVDECGHYAPVEKPRELAAHIAAFLDEL